MLVQSMTTRNPDTYRFLGLFKVEMWRYTIASVDVIFLDQTGICSTTAGVAMYPCR